MRVKNKSKKQNDDKYLTIKRIHELLGVSRSAVNRLIQDKKLQTKKIGRLVRISYKDYARFLENDDNAHLVIENQTDLAAEKKNERRVKREREKLFKANPHLARQFTRRYN